MRLSANNSAVGRSPGIRAICTEFWNSRALGTELVSYGDIQISSDAACGPSATEPLNIARRRATSGRLLPQCWPRSEMALRRDVIWRREQGRPGITSTARELLGSRDRHFYSPPGESTGARATLARQRRFECGAAACQFPAGGRRNRSHARRDARSRRHRASDQYRYE